MEPQHLPDIHVEAPILDVPDPPAGTGYAGVEDFRNAELLRVNGIAPDRDGVLAALRTSTGVLLAAAAHRAGELRLAEAAPELGALVGGADEVRAEAAYALARLGDGRGAEALSRLARDAGPVDLSGPVAAGYLARLGERGARDRIARDRIAAGLHSEHQPIRMIAAKQLHAFADPDLFAVALADPSSDVRWQALVQLRDLALGAPEWQAILTGYVDPETGEVPE